MATGGSHHIFCRMQEVLSHDSFILLPTYGKTSHQSWPAWIALQEPEAAAAPDLLMISDDEAQDWLYVAQLEGLY